MVLCFTWPTAIDDEYEVWAARIFKLRKQGVLRNLAHAPVQSNAEIRRSGQPGDAAEVPISMREFNILAMRPGKTTIQHPGGIVHFSGTDHDTV